MSRYLVHDDGKRQVVVGWDPPMGTFFGQIYALEVPDDEGDLIDWIGYRMREIETVEALEQWVAKHELTLDDETKRKLSDDSGAPWTPGPMQRMFGFTGKEE